MKICYIGDGSSIHVQRWVKWFANKGHDVHLITDHPRKINDVIIHSIIKGDGSLTKFFIRFPSTRNLIKNIKPNILHAHYAYGPGLFGALSGFHPFIVKAMGGDIGFLAEISKKQRIGVKYVLKKADLVHVHDEFARERAIELGCAKEKIIVRSSGGVNINLFSPKAKSEELRQELGIKNKPSIFFTRRLSSNYNSEVIINAIPHVIKELPDAKFIIIGYGNRLEEFENFIKKSHLEKNVNFLPKISHNELPGYIASVDLYVDTFYPYPNVGGHGIGTGTMEAMSCGTPIIMPRKIDLSENTKWFKGKIYEAGNSKSLAEAIVYLIKNEKERIEISKKSRDIAVENWNEEKIMNDFLDIYQKLIDKREINMRKNNKYICL